MKALNICLLVMLALTANIAHAMPATTNEGYLACISEQYLKNVVAFVVANDVDSIQAYMDSKKCVSIKAGLRVTVIDSPGMFGGRASFIFRGVEFWTVREALNYNQ